MKKVTTESFIEKAKQVHGDKYDYSEVEYLGSEIPISIICKHHGKFLQTPHIHIQGHGCPLCGIKERTDKISINKDEFTNRSNTIHRNKYDYSKVDYIDSNTKVCIICPEHGEFWQRPNNHLKGQGCPYCAGVAMLTKEQFIEKAKEIHGGDRYDYSKVDYVNSDTKVCIICPEHGEFWQTPHSHLQGKGCGECNISKGENKIMKFLKKNKVKFIYDKACLKFLNNLRPDFYLPEYNTIIEYDGEQHFRPVDVFGGEEEYKKVLERDNEKERLCIENDIRLVRLPYTEFDNIENILKEELGLTKK